LFAFGVDLRLGGRRFVVVLMWFGFKTQKGLSISKTRKGLVLLRIGLIPRYEFLRVDLKPIVLVT